MSIQASEQRLTQIFNLTNYQFEIPSYQRPYAWTKDQIIELIDDILDAFPDPDEDHPDYFLGSIILIQKLKKPQVEVVDGQQRLTTLTLLFSVFRDFLSPDNDAYNYINNFIEATGIGKKLYGLKVRPEDDSFFCKYIRTPGGIQELIEKDAGFSTDSQILFRDNARILKEELIARRPENISMELWIVYLLENILEKCYLVTVTTSNFDTAYRIFSTINTRGLDLQLNDILKAEIIGKIEGSENKEKYTQIWDGEESDLGRKDFETLFAHIHRIKTRKRPQESLLTEYRQKIKPQDNPTEFIDTVLKPCSDRFEIIVHQRFHCSSDRDKQEINRLFGWLNRIDNSDWLPPAIYFLVKHDDRTEQIKAFFTQLERLAAGLMILRADLNQRAKKYAQILDSIDRSAENAIITAKELLSPEEQKTIIEIIDGDVYLQNRTHLYILTRLDSALADDGLSPSFNSKMLTIEHVLPQNPKPDSDWCKNWEDQKREKWVHRLGNLVLLSKKKNSQAQNFDFEHKKNKYFKSDSVTTFPLTVNVMNNTNWTEDIVCNNQKTYVDKLVNIWNLSFTNI
jgi:hypothetical protein